VSVCIAALTIARKCCFMCSLIDVEVLDYSSRVVVHIGVVKVGNFG
jgi:hypothetical protein